MTGDKAALVASDDAVRREQAICDRCGIDLWSGADCALEGFACLGDEGELDRHLAELARDRARALAQQEQTR